MPKLIKIKASAKINLCLDVLKRTPSGYHKIQTVFQEIPEIHDDISIKAAKSSDNLSMIFAPKIPTAKPPIHPNDNLAFKALLLIKKSFKIKKFANITIKKNIPLSSGLGGASSDAAAVLKGLNQLWQLKLSQKKLLALAAKLGKDVPFFIVGGTAIGTNFGEKITPLPRLRLRAGGSRRPPIKNIKFKVFPRSGESFAIKKLAVSSSKTASAYAALNLSLCGKNLSKTKKLLALICQNSKKSKRENKLQEIIINLHNDFETITPTKPGHHLSGSGPSTYVPQL